MERGEAERCVGAKKGSKPAAAGVNLCAAGLCHAALNCAAGPRRGAGARGGGAERAAGAQGILDLAVGAAGGVAGAPRVLRAGARADEPWPRSPAPTRCFLPASIVLLLPCVCAGTLLYWPVMSALVQSKLGSAQLCARCSIARHAASADATARCSQRQGLPRGYATQQIKLPAPAALLSGGRCRPQRPGVAAHYPHTKI